MSILLSFGVVFGFSFITTNISEAKVRTFPNCKDMNKVYIGGVARSATTKNIGGKTKYKPLVSAALYKANEKRDRDGDGIACER